MIPHDGASYVHKAAVYQAILAGVTLALRCTQQHGWNDDHIAGGLALAEHQALAFGLSWPAIVGEVKGALGSDLAGVLDAAAAGAVLEGGQ